MRNHSPLNERLRTTAALAALLLAAAAGTAQQRYVRADTDRLNIRSEPSTTSSIVARADTGDVFELMEESGEWYAVNMFSGEWRYLYKPLATVVDYTPEPPADYETRRLLFAAFGEAELRAREEADELYPPAGRQAMNMVEARLLADRLKLEVAKRHGIQPPVYAKIVVEGFAEGW